MICGCCRKNFKGRHGIVTGLDPLGEVPSKERPYVFVIKFFVCVKCWKEMIHWVNMKGGKI